MSTIELTSVERVRSRLNLTTEDEAVDAVITDSMRAGPPALGSILSTPFVQESYTDNFYLNSNTVTVVDGCVRLRTSAGFLDPDSVVVTCGETLGGAGGTSIPNTDLVISAEKGWVLVPKQYVGSYIRIAYDAGFGSVSDVPEWLQEAATSHTIIIMSIHQMDDKSPELSTTIKTLKDEMSTILNAHLRVNGSATGPMR